MPHRDKKAGQASYPSKGGLEMIKKNGLKSFIMVFLLTFLLAAVHFGGSQSLFSQAITEFSKKCVACHQKATPGLVAQWRASKHFQMEVGCYECHKAGMGDKDHLQHSGTIISVIVSPKDCLRCHMQEVREFSQSAHFTAADVVLKSPLGQLIGDYVFGNHGSNPNGYSPAGINGCWRCHGYKVKVNGKGKLDPLTWPNMGVGRINPDGSKGSCSACHSGHEFSVAQARRSESCKECHSGGASLYEYQIYSQSKHGINYATNKGKMNLDSDTWIAGETYFSAPTCATCHISAGPNISATHNVSPRIKNNGDFMKAICSGCHTGNFTKNFFLQASAEKKLVKNKWKAPGQKLYCLAVDVLEAVKGNNYRPFTYPIDYICISFSQHANVAALAAFMMSPQFVEDNNKALAKTWFKEFVPELNVIIKEGKQSADPKAKKSALALEALLKDTLAKPDYGPGWPTKGIPEEMGCTKKKKSD